MVETAREPEGEPGEEIERLSEQLEEKEKAAQQLMSQPEHEREKEVAQLRRSVAEKERARAASDILCRSLAEETHQLRRTLAATAHMCQHLAKCLDERQRAQGDVGDKSPEVSPCLCVQRTEKASLGRETQRQGCTILLLSWVLGHPEPTALLSLSPSCCGKAQPSRGFF